MAPTVSPFAAATAYTATITLTAKAGFTLTGVALDFFTVAGATATNAANSGVVTAVFPATLLVVGASYGGGKVAYILVNGDTGYDPNVQHGLIAATANQSVGIRWYSGSYITTGATAQALGTGFTNTNTIISVQGATAISYAAGLARAYSGGGYTDWFLPSKDELNKLYINRVAIGGFADYIYWSSSEYNAYYAWSQYFSIGSQIIYPKSGARRVRAVRAF